MVANLRFQEFGSVVPNVKINENLRLGRIRVLLMGLGSERRLYGLDPVLQDFVLRLIVWGI